jgi:hypothetical protein
MSLEKAEARRIIEEYQERFWAMSWPDLDSYGERVETIVTPSGRRFRVKTWTFWDMEEWASGMNCIIKVRPSRGWRRFWAYKDWAARGAPDDPILDKPADRVSRKTA